MGLKLISVRLENIGGFRTTEIAVDSDALLVGENNSGKTSILRIIDWCLNGADRSLFDSARSLNELERQLLIPARETRNRARRIFLRVEVPDGRSAKKFLCTNGIAEIRLQFRSDVNFAKLGSPSRGELPSSEPNALELLERLQSSYSAIFIAAARDGRSALFEESLRSALRQKLTFELTYDSITGNPGKQRIAAKRSGETLTKWAAEHSKALWDDTSKLLHGGFEPEVHFEADITAHKLVELLVSELQPRFSLGDHDANKVSVDHLGAGLQSALAIALTQLSLSARDNRLLLLEEPEAFLHPSAQRTIAQQVLHQASLQTIATTHSSHILAEAAPSTVTIVRDHVAYPASSVDSRQDAVDQNFLSNAVAPSMFDRSLLLVEGAGDVAFYEQLRRDMRALLPDAILNRLRVSAVGSKDSFGPWLRLLRRFQDPNTNDYAFRVLVCADSIDATSSVIDGLRGAGMVVPLPLANALTAIGSIANDDAREGEEISERTFAANLLAASLDVPIHFNAVDLEFGMTENLSDERARLFARSHDIEAVTRAELRGRLGSKRGSAKAKKGAKAPYMRSLLSEYLTWGEVSDNVKNLLWRWITPAIPTNVDLTRPPELETAEHSSGAQDQS